MIVVFRYDIDPDPIVVLAWRLSLVYQLGDVVACLHAIQFGDSRVRE